MVEMDNVQQEIRDKYKNTWCPECGPCVELDIDYCCINCGSRCTGPGAEQATLLRAELETAKSKIQELQKVIEKLRVHVQYPHDLEDRD